MLGISNPVGAVMIDNIGAVTTTGAITAGTTVDIVAHSPLIIGSGGIMAGNISLAAGGGATVTTADVLTLLGPVTSTGGGIDLYASWTGTECQRYDIGQHHQRLSQTPARLSWRTPRFTSSNGGAITLRCGKNFVVSSLNSGSGPMFVNVGGILSSAPGFGGTNFVGDSLTLAASRHYGFYSAGEGVWRRYRKRGRSRRR